MYLICLLLLSGCISSEPEITPTDRDREFFYMPMEEQLERFNSLGHEDQYKLLIIGNQYVHPPALHLSNEFAKQGKLVVPLLRRKLLETNSESTTRDIVAVLEAMQRLDVYKVKDDSELMTLIEGKVAAMRGQWGPVTLRMIEDIKEPNVDNKGP